MTRREIDRVRLEAIEECAALIEADCPAAAHLIRVRLGGRLPWLIERDAEGKPVRMRWAP